MMVVLEAHVYLSVSFRGLNLMTIKPQSACASAHIFQQILHICKVMSTPHSILIILQENVCKVVHLATTNTLS